MKNSENADSPMSDIVYSPDRRVAVLRRSGRTAHTPLFVFNQFGDLERCGLRPGNVHSAAEWRDVLEPVVARYRGMMKHRYFRGDAAYANPGIYEFLEAEGYKYTIRPPANAVLQERIGWLLKRPVGRPPLLRQLQLSGRVMEQIP